jgi:hypothetical protein
MEGGYKKYRSSLYTNNMEVTYDGDIPHGGNVSAEEVKIPKMDGLVTQKTESLKMLNLTTKVGEKIDVHKDGCMMISLYDALVINGYKKSFEEFLKNLVSHDCLKKDGSIEWAAFNNSDTGYKFRWMQDEELNRCDKVKIENLEDWVKARNFALVKVQSLFLPWRRHFMVVLGVGKDNVECLEAGAIDGKLKTRTIPKNQLLGVRYFELKQGSQQLNQSGDKQISPFSKIVPSLPTLVTA